jgi:aerotaxis receptor
LEDRVPLQTTTPTGVERVVQPDDLLFSTTDGKGIIRTANSAFVRVSGFTLDELVGSPHHIVRHPDMPGGVFHVLWERILGGQPATAYLQNMARDGSHYWVFATVIPLRDGFLSVRMAPRGPLFDVAKRVYREVAAFERASQRVGIERARAAGEGAGELREMMRAQGFDGYEAFLAEALPSEVAGRARNVATTLRRPGATGTLADILGAVRALDDELAGVVDRLDAYRALATSLSSASTTMLDATHRLRGAVAAARAGSAAVAASAPALGSIAEAMARRCDQTVATLESLVEDLGAARALVHGLRSRIALARLHNDMVATFACEVVDGAAAESSMDRVALLCDALQEGVQDMAIALAAVTLKLTSVVQAIGVATDQVTDVHRFIGEWRHLAIRRRMSVELGPYVTPVDEQMEAGHGQLDELQRLARECRTENVPFDVSGLADQLLTIRAAVARP